MLGQILCFFFTSICGVPFLLIPKFFVDLNTPISFWSGDHSLKDKVRDVPRYNAAMTKLYRRYAYAFFAAGLGFLVMPIVGIVLICLSCTIGIVLVYLEYRKILRAHT